MKKDKHPKYQEVLFIDSSNGHKFLCGSCGSTLNGKETQMYNGKEYPVCHVSISSSSHPFFTGKSGLVDAEGRVDKFRKKYTAAAEKLSKPAVEKEVVAPTKKAAAAAVKKAKK